MNNYNPSKTPFVTTPLLLKNLTGEGKLENCNYGIIIGILNFLVNSTQLELILSVHPCTRFCATPQHSHEQAIKRISRYLKSTKNSAERKNLAYQGIIYKFFGS